jgi:hypothetical protein
MIGLDLRRSVWPDDDYRPLIRFTWPTVTWNTPLPICWDFESRALPKRQASCTAASL